MMPFAKYFTRVYESNISSAIKNENEVVKTINPIEIVSSFSSDGEFSLPSNKSFLNEDQYSFTNTTTSEKKKFISSPEWRVMQRCSKTDFFEEKELRFDYSCHELVRMVALHQHICLYR